MDILILTHHRIINNFNGAVTRIRHLSTQLSRRGAKVSIISLISPRLVPASEQQLAPDLCLYEATNSLQWLDGFATRLGLPPYSLAAFSNKFVPLPPPSKHFFDLIVSESPFLWQVARRVSGAVKVLSAHNYEAEYHSDFSSLALTFLKRNEIQAIKEADLIVSVSAENGVSFRNINPQVPIHVIPNGFENNKRAVFDRKKSRGFLKQRFSLDPKKKWALFIASESSHNLRGFEALYPIFLKPEIREKWTLLVVGNLPISSQSIESIICCGNQPELTPFFMGSDIALNPVNSGSGSNLKLIESLGNGLPVLTTPFGARSFKSEIRGLHVMEIESFENRLLSDAHWIKPKEEEVAAFEWSRLGNRLFEVFYQCLKNKERTL